MSITGAVGHVAFARQIAQGVPNTTAGQYSAVKITGDSLVASNNPLVAEGEIGLGRDVTDSVPGGFSAAGAVNGNLRARAGALFLEGVLGTKAIGGGIDTFTAADNLPFWTAEKQIGPASPNQLVIRYSDGFVNTLNITAAGGSLATYSAGLIFANEQVLPGGPIASIAYPANSDDLLVFHGGRIRKGDNENDPGANLTLARDETFQSIEISINNNVDSSEYTVRPNRFLRSLTEGIRQIDANMTMVFQSPAAYQQYTYGAAANVTPSYAFYLGQFELILGNFQLTVDSLDLTTATPGSNVYNTGTGATPAAPGSGTQGIQIYMPKLAFTGFPVALASGRIVVTTTARALRDPVAPVSANSILTAYVRPNNAAINY